jgi:NADPH:quinone reductase-like Zn-dependent oxidoreductase
MRLPEPARGVAISGLEAGNTHRPALEIDGSRVTCGVRAVARPVFDPSAERYARHVLLRVRAFSCNFLDRSVIRRAAAHLDGDRFFVIGSELVADVIATGRDVASVAAGDRVIGDNNYPGSGIPTSHASREYLVLPETAVARIPPAMPDAVAAAFSLGAQTAYSMVAKAGVSAGTRVLVTAASSCTSLAVLRVLRERGAHITATTTSAGRDDVLRNAGAQVLRPPGHETLGGFECVFDPFLDAHIAWAMPLVAPGGRYVTCGVRTTKAARAGDSYADALEMAVVKNVHLIGNCLGTTADLRTALADYAAGAYDVRLDSVFRGEESVAPFLDRTFNDPGRLGKTVFVYD